MSRLEESIAAWRQRLSERGLCAPADADELEDHLREEIAGLESAPLSEEETFLVAARRLGCPAAIGEEFAKVEPSSRYGRLLCLGALALLAYWAGRNLLLAGTNGGTVLFMQLGLSGFGASIPGAVMAVLCVSLFFIVLIRRWGVGRVDSAIGSWRRSGRRRVIAAVILLGAYFVPRFVNFLTTLVLTRISGIDQFNAVAQTSGLVIPSFHLMTALCLALWILRKPREPAAPEMAV